MQHEGRYLPSATYRWASPKREVPRTPVLRSTPFAVERLPDQQICPTQKRKKNREAKEGLTRPGKARENQPAQRSPQSPQGPQDTETRTDKRPTRFPLASGDVCVRSPTSGLSHERHFALQQDTPRLPRLVSSRCPSTRWPCPPAHEPCTASTCSRTSSFGECSNWTNISKAPCFFLRQN